GGWRIVINTGRIGGQEVDHLHVHILGGPRPWHWADGPTP
ncbi:MAG: HIT domain-containing protein, partial [Burkholderiaceae bacterium]|nr:HIT domain-containing protein [Burkholderiaceae bacterium]